MAFNKTDSFVKRPEISFASRWDEGQSGRAPGHGNPSEEFVALISHELRTPLTSVLGYLELVIDNEDLPPEGRLEYLRRAKANVNHLVYVLDSAQELSRLEAGRPVVGLTRVPLGQLLREVADAYADQAAAGSVRLTVEPVQEPLVLVTDRECLSKALAHLLSNACKYTPIGGAIRIVVRTAPVEVFIDVVDTGIGIPEEEHDKVFTRFYRGRNSRSAGAKGAGLGLASASALLGLLGGAITFKSECGAGSVFSIRLPLLSPVDPRD